MYGEHQAWIVISSGAVLLVPPMSSSHDASVYSWTRPPIRSRRVDSEGVEIGDASWQRPERSGLFEGSVGAVLIVVGLVVAEDLQ